MENWNKSFSHFNHFIELRLLWVPYVPIPRISCNSIQHHCFPTSVKFHEYTWSLLKHVEAFHVWRNWFFKSCYLLTKLAVHHNKVTCLIKRNKLFFHFFSRINEGQYSLYITFHTYNVVSFVHVYAWEKKTAS